MVLEVLAKINFRRGRISFISARPFPANQRPANSKQSSHCKAVACAMTVHKAQPTVSTALSFTSTHTQSTSPTLRLPTSNTNLLQPLNYTPNHQNGHPIHLLRQERRSLRLVWTVFTPSFVTIAYMTQFPTSQMFMRREVCSSVHMWKGSDRKRSDWTTLLMPYV